MLPNSSRAHYKYTCSYVTGMIPTKLLRLLWFQSLCMCIIRTMRCRPIYKRNAFRLNWAAVVTEAKIEESEKAGSCWESENSPNQERTHAEWFSYSKRSEHLASRWNSHHYVVHSMM